MELYIVRHGQTKWNEERKMQGSKNSDLTEKGILEAKKLGQHLLETEFDLIFTSPLGRTLETMNNIKGDRNLEVVEIEELKEMDFGFLEGQGLDKAREEHPEIMEKLWNDPVNYRTDTGEDYYELMERVELALEKISTISKERKIKRALVVTHGVVINVLLTLVKKGQVENIWDTGVVKNTSLTVLELEGDRTELKLYNDTSHLD